MEELTTRGAYAKASMADGTAIFMATASWCGQCKAIAPFVEQMILKYPEVRFYSYDVDKAEDIAQELGARQMPTFTVFKDGDLMDGVTGAKPVELEKVIRENYGGKVVGGE